jgi:hypothetical protein
LRAEIALTYKSTKEAEAVEQAVSPSDDLLSAVSVAERAVSAVKTC